MVLLGSHAWHGLASGSFAWTSGRSLSVLHIDSGAALSVVTLGGHAWHGNSGGSFAWTSNSPLYFSDIRYGASIISYSPMIPLYHTLCSPLILVEMIIILLEIIHGTLIMIHGQWSYLYINIYENRPTKYQKRGHTWW